MQVLQAVHGAGIPEAAFQASWLNLIINELQSSGLQPPGLAVCQSLVCYIGVSDPMTVNSNPAFRTSLCCKGLHLVQSFGSNPSTSFF